MARSMLLEPASFTFADAIEAATAIVESQTLLIQDAMGSLIQNPLPRLQEHRPPQGRLSNGWTVFQV